MILVWDNGKHYSDHAVHFIECGRWSPECVEKVVATCRYNGTDKGHAVAVIADAAWRDPQAIDTLAELIDPWTLCEDTYWEDDAARDSALLTIPSDMLTELAAEWRKVYPVESDAIEALVEYHRDLPRNPEVAA
jgi:hypothetical protein